MFYFKSRASYYVHDAEWQSTQREAQIPEEDESWLELVTPAQQKAEASVAKSPAKAIIAPTTNRKYPRFLFPSVFNMHAGNRNCRATPAVEAASDRT